MVSGYEFDPDNFLERSGLTHPTLRVWRKGEESLRPGVLHSNSGIDIKVSEANGDTFDDQVIEAIAFLKDQWTALGHLSAVMGNADTAPAVYLEFYIEDRDVGLQVDNFPSELLRLAGNLDIGIDVSRLHWSMPDDGE